MDFSSLTYLQKTLEHLIENFSVPLNSSEAKSAEMSVDESGRIQIKTPPQNTKRVEIANDGKIYLSAFSNLAPKHGTAILMTRYREKLPKVLSSSELEKLKEKIRVCAPEAAALKQSQRDAETPPTFKIPSIRSPLPERPPERQFEKKGFDTSALTISDPNLVSELQKSLINIFVFDDASDTLNARQQKALDDLANLLTRRTSLNLSIVMVPPQTNISDCESILWKSRVESITDYLKEIEKEKPQYPLKGRIFVGDENPARADVIRYFQPMY